MDYATSEKSRYLKFHFEKMKIIDIDEKCFELNSRYITHNERRTGETLIKI